MILTQGGITIKNTKKKIALILGLTLGLSITSIGLFCSPANAIPSNKITASSPKPPTKRKTTKPNFPIKPKLILPIKTVTDSSKKQRTVTINPKSIWDAYFCDGVIAYIDNIKVTDYYEDEHGVKIPVKGHKYVIFEAHYINTSQISKDCYNINSEMLVNKKPVLCFIANGIHPKKEFGTRFYTAAVGESIITNFVLDVNEKISKITVYFAEYKCLSHGKSTSYNKRIPFEITLPKFYHTEIPKI